MILQKPRAPARALLLLLGLLFALSPGLQGIVAETRADDDAANNGNAPPDIAARGAAASRRRSAEAAAAARPDPALDEDSVVLVTGAAGFLGSELALALRRTYRVRKLLLVDDLGIVSENEGAYVQPPPGAPRRRTRRAAYETASEAELGLFEMKRQRSFRIFHELTAARLGEEEGEEEDGHDAESVLFYRADMRPSIPEFFDFGELPLLEGIFQSHPGITHVVHLADVPLSAQNQAIPRNKDSIKTGRLEGLLEEMRLMLERAAAAPSSDGADPLHLPQFVYASSHEVYDAMSTDFKDSSHPPPNPPPFEEDKPITTPSSLHGTAKLIDEVLASAYHSTHGIYSVGLRFFDVYGPWNAPGTELFDLAEHVTALHDQAGAPVEEEPSRASDEDVKDYVFIDDAVDALLSAMQYRPPVDNPPPVVFNVGTGQGSTLREVRDVMMRHFTSKPPPRPAAHEARPPTASYASTSRAEALLGFRARVPLAEGVAHTLRWHRDRAYPFGRDPAEGEPPDPLGAVRDVAAFALGEDDAAGEDAGAGGGDSPGTCSLLDRECLRGAPVFPCASECGRPGRCTPSAWDAVAALSAAVTEGCAAVLYTVVPEEDAERIPSATAAVGAAGARAYVGAGPEEEGDDAQARRTRARCNVAFVSERSPLVRRLRAEGEEYVDEDGDGGGSLPPLLRHGFWTVLPVAAPASGGASPWTHAFDGAFALEYLPKVSPGQFFGPSVRHAVYAAPTVLFDDLPGLLQKMEGGPPKTANGGASAIALLLSAKRSVCDPMQRGSPCAARWSRPAKNDAVQARAYNMVRMALRGDMLGGAPDPVIGSSFLVHALHEGVGDDARLFRCDVYGETAQWGAGSDERALEFIVSLHDLWTRAVDYWNRQAAEAEGEGRDGGKDAAEKSGVRGATKDQWLGILSSTEVELYTHILPSESNGLIHLDDDFR